jgi:hypothetical protein
MPPEERWIETRRGGLFFVNALLIFPAVMVLAPLLIRVLVRAGGGLARFAPMLDTFPMIAEYILPRLGWLLAFPIGLSLYNLSLERGTLPRLGLSVFLLVHLAFFAWTLAGWTGLVPPVLPGGPPVVGGP